VSGRAPVSGPAALAALITCTAAAPAAAQPAQALELSAPRLLASGTSIPVRGSGAATGERVRIEIRLSDGRWARLAAARADAAGRFSRDVRPRKLRRRILLRAHTASGATSPRLAVRTRAVTLAAVGDVNLGDGPGAVMALRGLHFPWTGTARALRAADVAFGNLECAVSTRGAPVPKQFNFRGSPAALRVMARYAGFDVLNLANNHVGDYGTAAMLDTVKNVRRFGMVTVGAGGSLAAASKPRVVERLGLRIAFVGFSNILPASFFAGPDHAGTQPATPELISAGVRRARRRAEIVVATFHWGVERSTREDGRQRAFAATALAAGADAVIGAHPHVLQPIVRSGRRLVAYSLGNFVFGASSSVTSRTGILRLRLSGRATRPGGHRGHPPSIVKGSDPLTARAFLSVVVGLLVASCGGGGGDEPESDDALRVERSNQVPEILLYIDDESVNRPARAGGRSRVTIECLDENGLVLASKVEPWPMTETDGNTLAPHAHLPVNPARIAEVASCRINGTEPLLEGEVL
jgi:hypothetical protein